MSVEAVQFDANDLAERIEQLSQHELDYLPFGVILLDREGIVQFYSKTEARKSGYGEIPLGLNLFEISPCMAAKDFRSRIQNAMDKVYAEKTTLTRDVGGTAGTQAFANAVLAAL